MSEFLYYLPGAEATAARIEAVGLGYALGDGFQQRPVLHGPDANAGVVLGSKAAGAESIGYYPNRQTWRRIPQSSAWCGYDTDAPPGPGDLVRPDPLGGHEVELADGRHWLVPVARMVVDDGGSLRYYDRLPRRMHLDDDGAWTAGEPRERYRELDAIVESHIQAAIGEAGVEGIARLAIDPASAIAVLAVNYRLGPVEADVLGLFDWNGRQAMRVLDAACDLPGLERLKKKRDSDMPRGERGGTD